MRKFTLSLTLSVGLALVGCAAPALMVPHSDSPAPHARPTLGQGDLMLKFQLGDTRTLQDASVSGYLSEDIKKLEIIPMLKVGGDYLPLSKTGGTTTEGAPDQLIHSGDYEGWYILRNLAPDSTYRIRVRAFDASDNLISKDAGSVSQDVTIGRDLHGNTVTVPVQLEDKAFAATATAKINYDVVGATKVILTLLRKQAGGAQPVTVATHEFAASGTSHTVTLGRLWPKSSYTLEAKAVDAAGAELEVSSIDFDVKDVLDLGTLTPLELGVSREVTTYAGSIWGYQNGSLAEALFKFPHSLARDSAGNLYVSEEGRIRKIDTNGQVSTHVGSGEYDVKDGQGEAAAFYDPMGMVFDQSGNMFVADRMGSNIRKIDTNRNVTVYAGSGQQGYQDGSAASAEFFWPIDLAIDSDGTLYVLEEAGRIRIVSTTGEVSTLVDAATDNSGFSYPRGICLWNGELYVADNGTCKIWKITKTGVQSEFAGSGTPGNKDGSRSEAMFSYPESIRVTSDGTFYVTDRNRVVTIVGDQVKTLVGSAQSGSKNDFGTKAQFNNPGAVQVLPDGTVFVPDSSNSRVRKILPLAQP